MFLMPLQMKQDRLLAQDDELRKGLIKTDAWIALSQAMSNHDVHGANSSA
jgi:hypothetical protein